MPAGPADPSEVRGARAMALPRAEAAPAARGTEDEKAAPRDRKRGVRLRQSLPRNGLGDKARRGRPEEGVTDAVDEREDDEMPEPRRPANQQAGHRGLSHEANQVGGDQHVLASKTVGSDSGDQQKHDQGEGAAGEHESESGEGAVDRQDCKWQGYRDEAVAEERKGPGNVQPPEVRLAQSAQVTDRSPSAPDPEHPPTASRPEPPSGLGICGRLLHDVEVIAQLGSQP